MELAVIFKWTLQPPSPSKPSKIWWNAWAGRLCLMRDSRRWASLLVPSDQHGLAEIRPVPLLTAPSFLQLGPDYLVSWSVAAVRNRRHYVLIHRVSAPSGPPATHERDQTPTPAGRPIWARRSFRIVIKQGNAGRCSKGFKAIRVTNSFG